MLRVGGFQEFTPGEQLIFDNLYNIIQSAYKSYGYVHIETPAVERNDILLKGGEESSKQVFGLYGMAQGAEDLKSYGLHFDLTVPFTRYVLDHVGTLTFPFKRHQIQPVWRGERSQKGRFRQFYQADIDVIWRKSDTLSHTYYDAETLYVLNRTMNAIRLKYFPEGEWIMHVNNRKITTGFFARLTDNNAELSQNLYRLLDNYYKIGEKAFEQGLKDLGLNDQQFQTMLDFTVAKPHELDEHFGDHPLYQQGVTELTQIFSLLDAFNADKQVHFYYDPYIVRGLDYYTGVVFEVIDSKNMEWGSLSAGGRYENLAQSLDPQAEQFDGVGGSIGLSRLTTLILEKQSAQTQTHVEYLFVHFEGMMQDLIKLAQHFIAQGYSVEVFPEPIKLAKQFSYAEKKGIPHVVVFGQGEKDAQEYLVKSMSSGETVKHPVPKL